jgi:polar amino acid transport system substrate-binding protein
MKVLCISSKGFITITCLFLLMLSFTSNSKTTVTILADDDYPPYSYLENGELKGIYVDLLKRASAKLQLDYYVKIVPMPWKRALLIVDQGGVVGIIPPYLRYDARPYISSYSPALGTEFVVTYCHESIDLERALDLKSPSNKRLHIGINAGYLILNQSYKKAIAKGRIRIWENKSTEINVIKLLTRKVDCYVNARKAILYELNKIKKSNPQLSTIVVTEKDEIGQQTAHIGFSRNSNFPQKKDFIKRMNASLLDAMAEKN